MLILQAEPSRRAGIAALDALRAAGPSGKAALQLAYLLTTLNEFSHEIYR